MVQQVKLPLGVPASYIRVQVQVSATSVVIQQPGNVPGKTADDGPST